MGIGSLVRGSPREKVVAAGLVVGFAMFIVLGVYLRLWQGHGDACELSGLIDGKCQAVERLLKYLTQTVVVIVAGALLTECLTRIRRLPARQAERRRSFLFVMVTVVSCMVEDRGLINIGPIGFRIGLALLSLLLLDLVIRARIVAACSAEDGTRTSTPIDAVTTVLAWCLTAVSLLVAAHLLWTKGIAHVYLLACATLAVLVVTATSAIRSWSVSQRLALAVMVIGTISMVLTIGGWLLDPDRLADALAAPNAHTAMTSHFTQAQRMRAFDVTTWFGAAPYPWPMLPMADRPASLSLLALQYGRAVPLALVTLLVAFVCAGLACVSRSRDQVDRLIGYTLGLVLLGGSLVNFAVEVGLLNLQFSRGLVALGSDATVQCLLGAFLCLVWRSGWPRGVARRGTDLSTSNGEFASATPQKFAVRPAVWGAIGALSVVLIVAASGRAFSATERIGAFTVNWVTPGYDRGRLIPRASIVDRDGDPLAMTDEASEFKLRLRIAAFKRDPLLAPTLAEVLGLEEWEIHKKIESAEQLGGASPSIRLSLPSPSFRARFASIPKAVVEQYPRRIYSLDEAGSNVVGRVYTGPGVARGQHGLEAVLDQQAPAPAVLRSTLDSQLQMRLHRTIEDIRSEQLAGAVAAVAINMRGEIRAASSAVKEPAHDPTDGGQAPDPAFDAQRPLWADVQIPAADQEGLGCTHWTPAAKPACQAWRRNGLEAAPRNKHLSLLELTALQRAQLDPSVARNPGSEGEVPSLDRFLLTTLLATQDARGTTPDASPAVVRYRFMSGMLDGMYHLAPNVTAGDESAALELRLLAAAARRDVAPAQAKLPLAPLGKWAWRVFAFNYRSETLLVGVLLLGEADSHVSLDAHEAQRDLERGLAGRRR